MLLSNKNERIKYDVLETIFLCSTEADLEKFYHVPSAMLDTSDLVRRRAMELTSKAYQSQINAGVDIFKRRKDVDSKAHAEGLSLLLYGAIVQPEMIETLLKSRLPLTRKYGVLIAKKVYRLFPSLIALAAKSDDDDIQQFAKDFAVEVQLE